MDQSEQAYGDGMAAFYEFQMASGERERGDVAFYTDLAREADGPVLEMACGTGRIYLELLRAGVDADGFDLSAGGLDLLREKADDEGLDPNVWHDDMTDFSVEREYELVFCPFNAMEHLLSVEDQLETLRTVYDALAPGGRFVFDVAVPNFELICENYGEWTTTPTEYKGEKHEYRTRTSITDPVEQQVSVESELYDAEGELVFTDGHRSKMLPKREVELLARVSPFDDWDVAGDFDGSSVTSDDSVLVWTFRKADS
ncbi:class I SAM-dependent methyltransferase [Halorussus litoreus]|uniref:class I SAM-dependent methyltransferase n=1 Tax=Halorussus litoreus TaxID=1710536 RepID=UPI000E23E935|nr:class I SAM-dependent methyltransferase [Halorussus litoreus]